MITKAQIACHQCDLLVELTDIPEHHKALCPRCGYILTSRHRNPIRRVLAFSLTALLFLCLSLAFPFLTFSAQGQDQTLTLMQSIAVPAEEDFTSLAVLVFATTVVIPALLLGCALYVFVSLYRGKNLPGTTGLLKLLGHLRHWSMAEIYLIGILVSFIKITSLADVALGLSFWSYVLFIVSMTAALLHIDRHQIWQWVQSGKPVKTTAVSLRERYKSCHVCHGLAGESLDHCATCGSPLHLRVAGSIQRTWALLITSALLYIPANTLPIMRTNFLGEETENTILGGVVVLWRSGSYPISLVIFIASVFVPIGKIIALGWLCRSVQTRSTRSRRQKTQLYRLTEFVGRWSMVDVFVVAVLVALIQLGNIMSIYPDWGALAFAGVVFFTILAALSFDPRLLWDAGAEENRR